MCSLVQAMHAALPWLPQTGPLRPGWQTNVLDCAGGYHACNGCCRPWFRSGYLPTTFPRALQVDLFRINMLGHRCLAFPRKSLVSPPASHAWRSIVYLRRPDAPTTSLVVSVRPDQPNQGAAKDVSTEDIVCFSVDVEVLVPRNTFPPRCGQ